MNGDTAENRDVVDQATARLMEDPRLVVSLSETAMLLGVSRSFAYELARRGEIRVVRLGRRQVVAKHVLLQLIGHPSQNETSTAEGSK